MKFYLFIILLNLILFNQGYSQNYSALKSKFIDAEYYFLFDEFSKALPIYSQILSKDSSNANINYRIGLCYLYITGEKYKAIPFFEKAVKNITVNYMEGSFKEQKAPIDANLFLGDAYRVYEELDKAIDAYTKFKNLLGINQKYYIDLANMKIQSCEHAKKLFYFPLKYQEEKIGTTVNSDNTDYHPVVSADETKMCFTQSGKVDKICYSEKMNGEWTPPRSISNVLGTDDYTYTVSLSSDGSRLYVCDNTPDNEGDIYECTLVKNKWTSKVKLNSNINSRFRETFASVTNDRKMMYFTSNRKGGIGGMDIYCSKKDAAGEWGPAVNLGPKINTPYNEESPVILDDGVTLFFSSEGHYNMGGYDIFLSKKNGNGEWSLPYNVSYPLNTSDDDLYYYPVGNGDVAYYAKNQGLGGGLTDIYRVTLNLPKDISVYHVNGIVTLRDNRQKLLEKVKISILDSTLSDTIAIVHPNTETGEFSYDAPFDGYYVTFECYGYLKQTEYVFMPRILARNELTLDIEMIPDISNNRSLVQSNNTSSLDSIVMAEQNRVVKNEKAETANDAVKKQENLRKPNLDSTVVIIHDTINPGVAPALNQNNQSVLADNPDSRIFIRRNEYVVSEEVYVPDHLKSDIDTKYYILLSKSKNKLPDNYFSKYENPEIKATNCLDGKDGYVYIAGSFSQKSNTVKLLNDANDVGFCDARIINSFELNSMVDTLRKELTTPVEKKVTEVYTILLLASLTRVDISYFKDFSNVKEYLCNDGFHRYVYGEFKDVALAGQEQNKAIGLGYTNAFVIKKANLSGKIIEPGSIAPVDTDKEKTGAKEEKVVSKKTIPVDSVKTKPVEINVKTNESGFAATKEEKSNVTHEKTNNGNPVVGTNNGSTTQQGGEAIIKNIFFDFDKYQTDDDYDNLNVLANYMLRNKDAKIEILGYNDLQGDDSYNILLSKKRAGFVKEFLVQKGVNKDNLVISGLGKSVQISSDLCPESRKYNRRVEFKILKQGSSKLTIEPIAVPSKYKI